MSTGDDDTVADWKHPSLTSPYVAPSSGSVKYTIRWSEPSTMNRKRERTVRRRYLAHDDRMPVIVMPHVCVERKRVLVAMVEPKESLRNSI